MLSFLRHREENSSNVSERLGFATDEEVCRYFENKKSDIAMLALFKRQSTFVNFHKEKELPHMLAEVFSIKNSTYMQRDWFDFFVASLQNPRVGINEKIYYIMILLRRLSPEMPMISDFSFKKYFKQEHPAFNSRLLYFKTISILSAGLTEHQKEDFKNWIRELLSSQDFFRRSLAYQLIDGFLKYNPAFVDFSLLSTLSAMNDESNADYRMTLSAFMTYRSDLLTQAIFSKYFYFLNKSIVPGDKKIIRFITASQLEAIFSNPLNYLSALIALASVKEDKTLFGETIDLDWEKAYDILVRAAQETNDTWNIFLLFKAMDAIDPLKAAAYFKTILSNIKNQPAARQFCMMSAILFLYPEWMTKDIFKYFFVTNTLWNPVNLMIAHSLLIECPQYLEYFTTKSLFRFAQDAISQEEEEICMDVLNNIARLRPNFFDADSFRQALTISPGMSTILPQQFTKETALWLIEQLRPHGHLKLIVPNIVAYPELIEENMFKDALKERLFRNVNALVTADPSQYASEAIDEILSQSVKESDEEQQTACIISTLFHLDKDKLSTLKSEPQATSFYSVSPVLINLALKCQQLILSEKEKLTPRQNGIAANMKKV